MCLRRRQVYSFRYDHHYECQVSVSILYFQTPVVLEISTTYPLLLQSKRLITARLMQSTPCCVELRLSAALFDLVPF